MVSDEQLMAYVDGELDAAGAAEVAGAAAVDATLAARIEQARGLRSRIAAAYDAVADEPVPERLRQRAQQAPAGGPVLSWAHGPALAASLLVGVFLGAALFRGGGGAPLA